MQTDVNMYHKLNCKVEVPNISVSETIQRAFFDSEQRTNLLKSLVMMLPTVVRKESPSHAVLIATQMENKKPLNEAEGKRDK